MKTYIDEINERIKFVQSVTEKSAPLYQYIEDFGLTPSVENALKDMLFYILDSVFSGQTFAADVMAQDLAAIEAKCSMGGADDFSESAADATVRVARITQRDKSRTGA